MDVDKILRIGYFDNIKIDGILEPVYESTGTEILANSSFRQSLDKSDEAFKHGIAHLRVRITGESEIKGAFAEIEHMRLDREENNIPLLEMTEKREKYLIALMDIFILKSDYAIPFKIETNGKQVRDIEKLAKTPDELEIMLTALDFAKHIVKHHEYSEDWVNIAIVNKVYVYNAFRGCGISKWLHENLADIVNMYALVFPNGILMTYGDFAQEAESKFGLTDNSYNKMLLNHYRQLGYDKLRQRRELPFNFIEMTSHHVFKPHNV